MGRVARPVREEPAMRREEARALGSLGGGAMARFGGVAKGVHVAASQRIFRTLGPVGVPTRIMHDGISALAYGVVDPGLRAVPVVAGRRASTGPRGEGDPPAAG